MTSPRKTLNYLTRESCAEPTLVRNVVEFYNLVADEYGDRNTHCFTAAMRDAEEHHTREFLKGRSFETALDMGCGDGNFLLYVLAVKKIGLDFSIEMIKRHRRQLRSGTYLLADCRKQLVLQTSSVDIVHCSFVLDHIYGVDAFLKEVSRILNEQGVFLLSLYSPKGILERRPYRESFEYRTRSGKSLLVPSNFEALLNLNEKLEILFRVVGYEQIPTATINSCSIDYYVLHKR